MWPPTQTRHILPRGRSQASSCSTGILRPRKRDREAKEKAKAHYNKKHQVQQQEINEGDKVYRRNRQQSTTRGPWEPQPHTVTEVTHNQITGTRDGVDSSRDRGDWKKVHDRPAHLTTTVATYTAAHRRLPTLYKDVFKEGARRSSHQGGH